MTDDPSATVLNHSTGGSVGGPLTQLGGVFLQTLPHASVTHKQYSDSSSCRMMESSLVEEGKSSKCFRFMILMAATLHASIFILTFHEFWVFSLSSYIPKILVVSAEGICRFSLRLWLLYLMAVNWDSWPFQSSKAVSLFTSRKRRNITIWKDLAKKPLFSLASNVSIVKPKET